MLRDVHSCANLLRPRIGPQPPPSPPHWDSYTRALLVSKDRRHLYVTPWSYHSLPLPRICTVSTVHISVSTWHFVSPEGELWWGKVKGVNPGGAGLQLTGHTVGPAQVLAEHTPGQTKHRVIGSETKSSAGDNVVDLDPYVFGPPGSGSVIQGLHQAKILRKTLIPTVLRLLFDFIS